MWGTLRQWWVAALVVLASVVCESEASAKLNLPRALLPLPVRGATPPSIILVVTGASSCYSWSFSRDDVANVIPIEDANGCSTSAKVSSVPHLTYRQTAIVFAEDVHTGQVLRCDVIVDKISTLEVVTTTRELYVEEAPEAFEVRARDDQGNDFTSLDYVEFSWTVVSSLGNDDVIRIMKFEDSQYAASTALRDLETRGLRGDTVLLEGVSTGSAKVIVKLPQPEYKSIPPMEVTIRVVANLLIVPSDVSIQMRDSVAFEIIQIREGRPLKIPQPSTRYWLDIENDNIADLNKKTGIAVGTSMGQTRVFLRDVGETLDESGDGVHPPEAIIRVVTPHALKLELEPKRGSGPWSVQNGDSFTLVVHILDDQDRRIIVGPETRVVLELDETLIDVKSRSINGTILTGRARAIGNVPVVATLLSVAGIPVKPKISTNGEIQIFAKIKVIPPKVLLPWEPHYNTRQEIKLKAIGGDGTYVWYSDGSAQVDSNTGVVTATGPGEAKIVASMPSNPQIYGTSVITIVEPMRMEVVWHESEGPVGSDLAIHIALSSEIPIYSEKYSSLDRCDYMHFKLISMEGIHFEMATHDYDTTNETLKEKACAILWAKCSEIGSGLVVIRLGKLEVALTLGCYAPIERVYPPASHSSILLTVGSSLNVIFTGGPITWFSGETEIQKEIKISDTDIVKAAFNPVSSSNLHVFTVTCLELGESDIFMKILGNREKEFSLSNTVDATVKVICSNPAAFKLSLRQNIDSKCPVTSFQASLLSGGGPIELEVSVLDNEGHVFHNASSVRVRWSSKPTAVLSDLPLERFLTKYDQLYNIYVVGYHYQILNIAGNEVLSRSNSADIFLEALGFRGSVLKLAGVSRTPSWSNLPQASLSLRLVAPVQVTMTKIVIYNSRDNIITLPLTHGSGSFDVALSSDEYVQVSLDHSNGRNLKIIPLNDGEVTVTVIDLCVNSAPVIIQVRVVSVYNIVADMPELIEKGQSANCFVRFYDRSGVMLPVHSNGAPTLTTKINEGRISVNPSSDENNEAVIYTVTGLDVGDASVEFTAGTVKTSVSTHVFAPLRIVPKNSILLPGGSIALKTLGGPPPPATVKFHRNAKDIDIINVSNAGVVTGNNLGTAGIEACVDGLRTTEVACASANVRVIPLEGVSIYAPTSTLLIGNTMPLWVIGTSDNLTPLEIGSLKSSLYFRWSLSGDGSANIHDILSSSGVEFHDSDRVSIRLTAVHPGSVTVHLNVTSVPGSILSKICGHSWYARFDLTVLEPLRMINPQIEVASLLLAPHSTITLETNYVHDNLIYSVQEDERSSEPLVKILPDGKLTTFSRLGRAVLTISSIDSDAWSKQHITISLEIRAPHYAMIDFSESTSLDKLSGLAALPMGLTLPLTISKFDILGRKFATSTQNIRYLTNRPDLLSITTNSTQFIELLLSGSGSSVIKVWDPSSEKQFTDYISLHIQTALHPSKVLATVGDIWCMRSAIKDSRWIESSDGAVWADSTGLSQARISNVAATSLVLQAPSGLPYSAHATVLTRPVDVIHFLGDALEHVATDEKPYVIHLILANQEEYEKYSNVLFDEKDCLSDEITYFPFTCEVKHTNGLTGSQISAVPVFDKHRGTYGCKIIWTFDYPSNAVINTNYTISLTAHSGSVSTEPLSIRLIKSPKIQPEKIVLSPPPASAASIDILATKEVLNQLKIVPKDDILTVEGPIHLSDTNVRYVVRGDGNSYGPRKAHILLISPLTHQNTEIPVNINGGSSTLEGTCAAGGSSPIFQLLQTYQPFLLTVIMLLVILVASVYVYGNIIYPLQIRRKEYIPSVQANDLNSQIRNMSYHSRSPLASLSSSGLSSSQLSSPGMSQTPPSPNLDFNTSAVYGDPSYFASAERRRNRRFL